MRASGFVVCCLGQRWCCFYDCNCVRWCNEEGSEIRGKNGCQFVVCQTLDALFWGRLVVFEVVDY